MSYLRFSTLTRLKIRYITAILVSCALFIVMVKSIDAAEKTSPTLEKVVIQLKFVHQFQFAGYYAAKEKGFYDLRDIIRLWDVVAK